MGKHTVCVQSLTFLAQKALFSIQFFGVKILDYKAVSSVIFTNSWCTHVFKRKDTLEDRFSGRVSKKMCSKGFIRLKQLVFANTLDNQRVSNLVFCRCRLQVLIPVKDPVWTFLVLLKLQWLWALLRLHTPMQN